MHVPALFFSYPGWQTQWNSDFDKGKQSDDAVQGLSAQILLVLTYPSTAQIESRCPSLDGGHLLSVNWKVSFLDHFE